MGKTTHAHCTKSLPSPCATIDTLSFLARFHFFCISAYFQQRPGHKSRAVLPTTENPTSFCTSRTPSPLSHVSHPTESLVDAALSIRSVIVVMIFWNLERSTVAASYYLYGYFFSAAGNSELVLLDCLHTNTHPTYRYSTRPAHSGRGGSELKTQQLPRRSILNNLGGVAPLFFGKPEQPPYHPANAK